MPCLIIFQKCRRTSDNLSPTAFCAVRWTFEPGDTGSTLLFYARVTDIVLGVIVVLIFDLIFPWCDHPLVLEASKLLRRVLVTVAVNHLCQIARALH